ncbi:MAG: class IV adenylate cyclase [Spirochaetaceae bacterium]|jgi:adenylate cyclase class 2|nr:class IV adenylate cyclase [Spirochaetaceae bacterium]
MAYEIELKAWVDDVKQTEARLNKIARFLFSFQKEDVYWYCENKNAFPSGVRLRNEKQILPEDSVKNRLLITYKTKETRDGVEVNEEKEFRVADGPENFEEFMERSGFAPGFSKKKTGKSWCYDCKDFCGGVTAELTEIDGLGWFLEMEILSEDGSQKTVDLARAILIQLLDDCGVPPEKIESRYYSEMLVNKP